MRLFKIMILLLLLLILVVLLVIAKYKPYHAAWLWNPVLSIFASATEKINPTLIKDFMDARPLLISEYKQCSNLATDVGDISEPERALAGTDKKWKMIPIKLLNAWQPSAINCPVVTNIIKKYANEISTAYYSILEPGKILETHTGPTKSVIRCHIPIVIPNGDVGLEVDGHVFNWSDAVIFDDTLPHRAWNNTNETRVVLLLDLIRPMPWPINQMNRIFLNVASTNF